MKVARILEFGSPNVIQIADIARPIPAEGQVLVKINAAGVGPWDAFVREGKSVIPQPLPLTLGSDLSGVIEKIGSNVPDLKVGDEVFGVTNPQFTGGYAEYAVAEAGMLARKPKSLNFIEAASIPVIAVTALQMLVDYAKVRSGQVVLVLGGAGNVGAYAVRLAKLAKLHVIATASTRDMVYVQNLGADRVINYENMRFEEVVSSVDAILDTVGGETRDRSFRTLRKKGTLISIAGPIPQGIPEQFDVRAVFFLVEVTTGRLARIAELFNEGKLTPQVGTVLSLEEAVVAHEMLAGAPHKRGKIVLKIDG